MRFCLSWSLRKFIPLVRRTLNTLRQFISIRIRLFLKFFFLYLLSLLYESFKYYTFVPNKILPLHKNTGDRFINRHTFKFSVTIFFFSILYILFYLYKPACDFNSALFICRRRNVELSNFSFLFFLCFNVRFAPFKITFFWYYTWSNLRSSKVQHLQF